MSYFLACLVVRDLCRSECRQNYYLTPLPIFSLPTILSLTQVTVLSLTQVTISGRLKLVSVPFSSLVLYIGHAPWEKFPGEHHVKLWDGTKLLRFAESASSNIVLYSRFIWLNGSITLIGLREKGTILFAFLRWPLSLWPREQALRSQMN